MYHHVKKLMYTVRVDTPDPKFGNMLLEQFGGANGELAAAMQYSVQGLNCDDPERKDLLMDIGTEELSHLEIVGALARLHLKPHEVRPRACGGRSADRHRRRRRRQSLQLAGQPLDRRLPEDHRRARRRSAQQHRRRGARQDRLRAPDQLHHRCGHERRAAVPDDARDHAHEGVHGGAREHEQAALHDRQDSADARPGRSVLQHVHRRRAKTARSMRAVRGTKAKICSWSRRRRSRRSDRRARHAAASRASTIARRAPPATPT